MKLTSLDQKTNLIFAKRCGKVTDMGRFLIIQSNPGGNYLIFDSSPKIGDYLNWTKIFNQYFSYKNEIQGMVFTWEGPCKGDLSEFLQNGFKLDEHVTLTAQEIVLPPKYNNNIEIKKILSKEDWANLLRTHTPNDLPKDEAWYEKYKREQMEQYQSLSENNMGFWFGAYLNGKLVGDLGLFYEGNLARFQRVGTDPQYLRQGICQTLMYESSVIAFKEFGVSDLVITADTSSHSLKIYESLGFKPAEKKYTLWKVGN